MRCDGRQEKCDWWAHRRALIFVVKLRRKSFRFVNVVAVNGSEWV